MFEHCFPRGDEAVPPLHLSVVYRYLGEPRDPLEEVKYGRENNPTTMLLEQVLSCIEETRYGLVFNTGMAVLSALFHEAASRGKRVLVSRLVYGSTRQLAEKLLGNKLLLAGPPWDELLALIERADMVLVETMANPTLRVPPLPEISNECRRSDCVLVVDNTFATPVIYRPGNLGAIVVESLTKYISGHNDVLGGFVGSMDEELHRRLWEWRRLLGTILQPVDAYLAYRGLRTLEVRVKQASETAMRLAQWLEESGLVERVYYPGLSSHPDHATAAKLFNGIYGGVLSFDTGSQERAKKVLQKLRGIIPGPSLGAVDSIASYPFTSSHRWLGDEEKKRLGITPGLVRLSVGLESFEYLRDELSRVLRES